MLKTYHSIQAHNKHVILLDIDYLLYLCPTYSFFSLDTTSYFVKYMKRFIQKYNIKINDTKRG